MTKLNKMIALLSASAMFCTSTGTLQADCQPSQETGCAFESSQKAPSVSPAIVLGVVVVIAIVAVVVQNKSH